LSPAMCRSKAGTCTAPMRCRRSMNSGSRRLRSEVLSSSGSWRPSAVVWKSRLRLRTQGASSPAFFPRWHSEMRSSFASGEGTSGRTPSPVNLMPLIRTGTVETLHAGARMLRGKTRRSAEGPALDARHSCGSLYWFGIDRIRLRARRPDDRLGAAQRLRAAIDGGCLQLSAARGEIVETAATFRGKTHRGGGIWTRFRVETPKFAV